MPKQIAWHNTTQQTVAFLQNNAEDIVTNLQKIRSELDGESNYALDFRRYTFKNGVRMNILNEFVPSFVEDSKNPRGYNNKPYTAVIYLDTMKHESMKMVYREMFYDRKPKFTEHFNGYSIAVFNNSKE